MNSKTALLSSLLTTTSVTLLHCGGGSPQGTSTSVEGLTDQCSGTYSCTGGAQTAQTTLSQQGGACYAGEILLDPGGTATVGGQTYTWQGNAAAFSLCDATSDCLECTEETDGSAPSSSGGSSSSATCQGTPKGCPEFPPCYEVRGCQLLIHSVGEDTCDGYPTACAEIGDENDCLAQGCSWQ
ncbi:MAG TPA: hypothetical protein VGL57_00020 [Solirubrobacteraceae bacterium]|jgi:hypothetical protein